jgi:hypothetical protein
MHEKFTPMFLRVALLSATLLPSLSSNAAIYNLNNKNSAMVVDSTLGIGSWTIDGVSHLYYHSWFYRLGNSGPESLVQSLGTETLNQFFNASSQSQLDLTYASASVSVRTVTSLIGKTTGSGSSQMGESITVRNLSAGNIDFNLFQYADFDLSGSASGQTVQFFQNTLNNEYYQVVQTDGSSTYTSTITTAGTPIAHFQAGAYPTIITSLQDGTATTLNDTVSAGPGDAEYAYQWTVTLAPNQSFQISKVTSIVPEPSSLALVGISLAAFLAKRRSRL